MPLRIPQTYTLQLLIGANFNPVDATAYYIGVPGLAPSTTADSSLFYIPRTGTIDQVQVGHFNNGGTGGSSETFDIIVRLNATSDTTVISSTTLDAASNASKLATGSGLSIAVTAGDSLQIKFTTPAWATNPTNLRIFANIRVVVP